MGQFVFEVYDATGRLKSSALADNKVVNVGVKDMNEKYLAGSSYTAAFYIGLIEGSSPITAATDTMSSHAGWTEATPYSNSTRPSTTFGTATTANPSAINSGSGYAVFNINATTNLYGAFLTTDSTKSGTTGILFCVANLTSGVGLPVPLVSGDTLRVYYSFSLTGT